MGDSVQVLSVFCYFSGVYTANQLNNLEFFSRCLLPEEERGRSEAESPVDIVRRQCLFIRISVVHTGCINRYIRVLFFWCPLARLGRSTGVYNSIRTRARTGLVWPPMRPEFVPIQYWTVMAATNSILHAV